MTTLEVGQRYRYEPRPTHEFVCPGCNEPYGQNSLDKAGQPCRVIDLTRYPYVTVGCSRCNTYIPPWEGIFGLLFSDGTYRAAPYTWLVPEEES
jgi:hypothetical protein